MTKLFFNSFLLTWSFITIEALKYYDQVLLIVFLSSSLWESMTGLDSQRMIMKDGFTNDALINSNIFMEKKWCASILIV